MQPFCVNKIKAKETFSKSVDVIIIIDDIILLLLLILFYDLFRYANRIAYKSNIWRSWFITMVYISTMNANFTISVAHFMNHQTARHIPRMNLLSQGTARIFLSIYLLVVCVWNALSIAVEIINWLKETTLEMLYSVQQQQQNRYIHTKLEKRMHDLLFERLICGMVFVYTERFG